MRRLCSFISKYMAVLVLAAAVIAMVVPDTLSHISPSIINYLLGVVMLGMGLTLNLHDFRVLITRPKDILIGFIAQFTIMPLLAWALCRLFSLDQALAIGVVLVGCCPGGTASNVITYMSRGDLALSIGITGLSTLMAPLMTPMLTWLLVGHHVAVDTISMVLSIMWVVILPIVAGVVIKRLWPKATQKAEAYLPAFSTLAITFIVMIVIAANAQKLLTGGMIIIIVVMLHNLCGLALGYTIARLLKLSSSKRKAISIEVGMQNSGLATSLATMHFASYPLATIPGAIFSVWHNISGALIAKIYSHKDI